MPRRDFTGKEFYKNIALHSKLNDNHYCFIGIRTMLDSLDFFVKIFKDTNYLFELSGEPLEIPHHSEKFFFQSFLFHDTLSEHFIPCLVNKDTSDNQYLLGENKKNTCYVLNKSKKKNQLLLSFEDEDEGHEGQEEEQENNEEITDELKVWMSFKETMSETSTNLMGRIDFLFPVKVQTYEILKPLFLKFSSLHYINYRLVFPREIKEYDLLIATCEDFYHEQLTRKRAGEF